jgi:O-antigen ligase
VVLGSIVMLPGALNRFVFPKLAATAAGVAVTARSPAGGRLPRFVLALLGLGLAVLVIAALAGADPLEQLVGVAPRYEGVLVVGLYAGALLSGARLLGPERPAETDRLLLRLLAGAAIAVAFLALLEVIGLSPFESNVSRPGSLLGNASDQGAWAVLVLGPLLLLAMRAPSRLAMAGAASAVLAVVLSGSRGALLGAAVVLVVLMLLAADRHRRVVLAGVAVAASVLAFALPAVRGRLLGEGLAADTLSGRGLLWQESWRLFLEHPVLGVGPGGFGEALRAIHGSGWYAELGTENPPDSPHSWPLQALLAGGPALLGVVLVGATLLVRAALVHIRADRWSLQAGLAAGLAGYGVALLFHFTGPGHTPLAALFAGSLLAARPLRRAVRPIADHLVFFGAGLLAAVATLGAIAEVPLREAVVRLADGDGSTADEYFSTAQGFRWWDSSVPATAGHAFAVAGRAASDAELLDHAEAWLDRAPASSQALIDLGTVREARGDLTGAAEALDAALRRDPANPEALLIRGIVAARGERWDDAEDYLTAAAASAPDSPAPWENLARVRRAVGDDDAARDAERTAADLGD